MAEEVDERVLLARERTVLAAERNRLANERTFLAWIRTGLASVGGGLAIIRFLTFQNFSHQILSQVIGCVLVILGIAFFGLSLVDYKNSLRSLQFTRPLPISTCIMVTISCILMFISFVMLGIVFKFEWP